MKNITLLLVCILSFNKASFAQIPSKCFEIESILVDACGNPENGNEMVRFKVGPSSLDASNMIVDWPNNNWLGLIQDATTASTTSDLNATVIACGYLKEPTSYILPAGADVLLITSQYVSISANSFANLTDTLYVLYQNLPVPTSTGHFSNSASTPRTLIIDFSAPTNCGDTVTYIGANLPGGNGARADFLWDGTVSYANDGCQAPINSGSIDISSVLNNGTQTTTLCFGDNLDLIASASGNYLEIIWSSEGEGTFTFNDTLNTTYQSSVNDTATFKIFVDLVMPCDDTIRTEVTLNITNPTIKDLSPVSFNLCPGGSVTLHASGGVGSSGYSWTPGSSTADSLVVTSSGNYSVSIFDGCFTETLSATIGSSGSMPVVSINGTYSICQGDTAAVSGNSTDNFLWSDGTTLNTMDVTMAGDYFLSASNSCGVDTAFFSVADLGTSLPAPILTGDTLVCDNIATTLMANGASTYVWSNPMMASGGSFTTTTAGNYYVIADNTCGSDTTFFTITTGSTPDIDPIANVSICDGVSATITATGASNYVWSDNSTGNTFTTSNVGNYFVSSTSICGTDSEQFTILSSGSAPAGMISGNLFTCEPNSSSTLTVSGGDSYLWSTGNTTTTETYTTNTSGTVTVINSCGQDIIPFTIVFGSINASFEMSDTIDYEPATIAFTNTSSNATSSNWDFGNGIFSNDYDATNLYSNDGIYTITLITFNSYGCTDTATGQVTILPIPEITIPNIFTPNSDKTNDYFTVSHPLITNIKGSIYNRWGNLLYQSDATDFIWNGYEESGKPAPDGTYFYIFEITLINDEVREESGSIMLSR
jgi:gliding motility-associated-like protein